MSDSANLNENVIGRFQAWRDGEPRAMDDLVRAMTPVLWHTVRAYGLATAAAEDVIQTTWLTLIRKHETIERPEAVIAWLTTTARREAWRASRTDRRDIASDEIEQHLPSAMSAEADATERSQRAQLWESVKTLDERCRRLLRVVAFAPRPDYQHLASDLSMPIGSIGPTRRRCLTKLRAALGSVSRDELVS